MPWPAQQSGSSCWAWFTHSMQWFCHAGYVPPPADCRDPLRGRVLGLAGILGAALVLGVGAPAWAAGPTAAGATHAAVPSTRTPTAVQRCQVTDPRLAELSGLVVIGQRMLAMSDGGDRVAVYLLDERCRIVEVHAAAVDPYDHEDLAEGADRTVWLSDTGDNRHTRATVALIALHPDGTTGVYRLTYPDGPHDAEALLLAPDGTPYVVTKDLLGVAGVYRPATALVAGRPRGRRGSGDDHRRRGVERRAAPRAADLHRRLRRAAGRFRCGGGPGRCSRAGATTAGAA